MAIALVREGVHDSTGTATATLTGVDINAGDCVVIICHPKTGSSQDVSSVTDSAGNTYANPVTAFVSGANSRCSIWYCLNATPMTAGTVTVTMTNSLSLTTNISDWSGVASVSALDVSNGQGNAASTTPPACTVTTLNADDVVIGALSQPNATAPTLNAGGFTAMTGSSPAATWYGAQAYQIVAATGTYGPSWALATAVATGAATIALKAATGGSTDASVTAVVATATGTAAAPTVSASATVNAVAMTATATALAPTVSSTGTANVSAVAATATAAALAPALSASATVQAVVATATATALAPTVSTGTPATVNAVAATATGQLLIPTLTADATVQAVAMTATAGVPAPSVTAVVPPEPTFQFMPPTYEAPMPTLVEPLKHYRETFGISVVRVNGVFQAVRGVTQDMLTAAGENGRDYFIGGYVYQVPYSTAVELDAAGFPFTDLPGFGQGPFDTGLFGV